MKTEEFMDNREKRIENAFNAIGIRRGKMRRIRKKLLQPTSIAFPLIFCCLLTLFTLLIAFLAVRR